MTLSAPPTWLVTRQTFDRRSLLPLKPDTLWRIETGVVRNMTWFENGNLVNLGLWGPGDVVGRVLFLEDQRFFTEDRININNVESSSCLSD